MIRDILRVLATIILVPIYIPAIIIVSLYEICCSLTDFAASGEWHWMRRYNE